MPEHAKVARGNPSQSLSRGFICTRWALLALRLLVRQKYRGLIDTASQILKGLKAGRFLQIQVLCAVNGFDIVHNEEQEVMELLD